MSSFYLDDDPEVSAKLHSDEQLGKTLQEVARVLSSAWQKLALNSVQVDWLPPQPNTPYGELAWLHTSLCGNRICKMWNEDSPALKWVCTYGGNYNWLYRFGMALLEQYTKRYDRIHAATPVIRALELTPPPLLETENLYFEFNGV
jgi:hypothetical protein